MNPFLAVLNKLGWLTSPTHEDYDQIWLLLNYAAQQYDTFGESSTHADPWDEVLSRFSKYPGPAYTRTAPARPQYAGVLMPVTFNQLLDAAKAANAKDPSWVAELCRNACCIHDDPIGPTIESVRRAWPKAFYSAPRKGKR